MSDNYEGQSILDIDTSDAVEPTVMPDGSEVKIAISGYKSKDEDGVKSYINVSDSGNAGFVVNFIIPDEISAKGFSKWIQVPTKELIESAKSDTTAAKKLAGIKWGLEVFKRAFGMSEVNFQKVGQETWAILGVENDPQYGEKNFVKKFITGA